LAIASICERILAPALEKCLGVACLRRAHFYKAGGEIIRKEARQKARLAKGAAETLFTFLPNEIRIFSKMPLLGFGKRYVKDTRVTAHWPNRHCEEHRSPGYTEDPRLQCNRDNLAIILTGLPRRLRASRNDDQRQLSLFFMSSEQLQARSLTKFTMGV